jgi:multicomponent Na+:H+ antiporter subunit C
MFRAHLPYLLATAVFLVGVYCVVAKKSLVKIVIGLTIAEIAVNLFLVMLGYNSVANRPGAAPIETPGMTAADSLAFVDPVPQALVITSVVVGLSTLVLAVAICIRLYDRYGTYDVTEIKRLHG